MDRTILDALGGLGWLDLAMLAVLLGSILVGIFRGLVFEVLSLIGWLAAFVVAQRFAVPVAAHLPVGEAGGAANAAAGFLLVFFGVLIAWSLGAKLVRLLVQATPLSGLDRLLGGAFGVLRGVLLLLVATTFALLTPAHDTRAWHDSHGAQWLQALLVEVRPLLPDDLARHLPGDGLRA